MALSPIGEAVLIAREGRRLKAYRDSEGVWTIGVGVTSASGLIAVKPGMVLTTAECDLLSKRAFALYAGHVDRALAGCIVPQHTYDALVSVCFNIGPTAFRNSTFLKHVRAGEVAQAQSALLWWNKPAAIVGRRRAEADQLVTPYAVRMPSRVQGTAPIRAALPAGDTGARAVVTPPVLIPTRRQAADLVLPDWWMALARRLDGAFAGPRKSAF